MPRTLPQNNPTRRWTGGHPWQGETGRFRADEAKRARMKEYATEALAESARERRRERER